MIDDSRLPIEIENIKNLGLEKDFEPSLKTIIRIMKSMLEHAPEAKTSLSVKTNLNYTRLAKHIIWLEKKGLVESTIEQSRINVGLTPKGRLFVKTIIEE